MGLPFTSLCTGFSVIPARISHLSASLCYTQVPFLPSGMQIGPQFYVLFSPRVSQFSILIYISTLKIKVGILGYVPMIYKSSCRGSRHMTTRCIETAETHPFTSMYRHISQWSNHLQRKCYRQSTSSQT